MKWIRDFWSDESGLILSAEAVTVGTVGVLGAVVGMNAVGTAVDSELKEMASAIRSLDQSYCFAGHRGCGAWTAGSYYIQPDVQQSLADLSADGDVRAIQEQIDTQRKAHLAPAPQPQKHVVPVPTPLPNQIPTPEAGQPVEPQSDSSKPQS